ncbi:MAG: hypothetical protein GX657_01355 [Chloroflexi bacterium]|nr:hypothetical protein [Chloroflexota bacterium]
MASSYDRGDLVRLSVVFTDAEGVATDPTTITCTVKAPSGTVTVYTYGEDAEVVKDGVGAYHLDLEISASGEWHYRWAGTGACTAAGEGRLYGAVSSVL